VVRQSRAATIWFALSLGLASAGAAQPLPASASSEAAPSLDAAVAETVASPETVPAPEAAGPEAVSPAIVLANWVIATHDHGDMPFMVIDKVGAEVFVYDADGQAIGQAPALVGAAKGDESSPGVGDRELSHIPLAQRTTPAGRFVAKFGPASGGHKQVLWVDYPDAISLHAVITANKKERRLQRLESATPKDNRITFGCINVPTAFYHQVVEPLLKGKSGIVYILPDTRPLSEVFAAVPFPNEARETASADH
jgi:hypothetical protein